MKLKPSPSLFWTFAGAFLAVVVVATILHIATLNMLFSSSGARGPHASSRGQVMREIPTKTHMPFISSRIPLRLVVYVPIALLVAGGGSLLLFQLFIRRIRRLENLAQRIAEGELDARVETPGMDEIGRLGSQLNRMAEKLSEARDGMKESERQRQRLLMDVSHELSTPLTSVRGFAETLLNPEVTISEDEHVVFLQNILEESERIDLLVQDLFDLTRLEAGASPLHIETIDLVALSRRMIGRQQYREGNFDGRYLMEAGEGKIMVSADGRRLEQVLDNLLTNAFRYAGPHGQVRMSVTRLPHLTDPMANLTISDDGPGFNEIDLPHVFERFYRGDPSRSSKGTGLGLAIVREIIQRHGGKVLAENRPSGGASISITLPYNQTSL